MELETVEGVEILATGRYALETGETEFTAEHLADAVRAATDPTIVDPRIKLGHDFEKVFGDAAPAFGKVKNMRLAANGQKIVGDLVDVPKPLARALASSYPGRSIEGGFDFDAPSGNQYKLVISDLALLGTSWPGVTNLKDIGAEDLLEIITANGRVEEPVAVDARYKIAGGMAGTVVSAKIADAAKPVAAGLNVAEFRKVFARDLRDGKVPTLSGVEMAKCWARSVEADDGGKLALVVDDEAGHLIEFPVAVEGEGLKYGGPRFREAVAASSGKGSHVLASWPSPGTSPSTEERLGMDKKAMCARLGLPENASDAEVIKAAGENPEKLTAETPDTGGGEEGEEGTGTENGDGTEESAEVTDGATLVTASGKRLKLADGMVIVDKDTFEEVKAGAKAGSDLAKRAAVQERDEEIKAAIGEGKFPVGRRKHYETLWNADPEGARAVIASLAPGLVPVSEIGRAGDPDDTSGGESEEALVAAFEAQMLPELAASSTSTLARVIATTNGGSN